MNEISGAATLVPSVMVRVTFFSLGDGWAEQWKGINREQSTTWQHLSQLKASAFFSLQIFLVVMKHSNLYLGLVLPSEGWQSLIEEKLTASFCRQGPML